MISHRTTISCRLSLSESSFCRIFPAAQGDIRGPHDAIRKGFSLIELLLAMSVGSTVMLLSVGLLHRTMAQVSRATDRAEHQAALNRLVESFRRDVHNAVEVELRSPQELRLQLSSGAEVTYQYESHVVRRSQRVNEEQAGRDSFSLLPRTNIEFSLLAQPQRISLNVTAETELDNEPPVVDRRSEAVIGRLANFERAELAQ